MSQVTMRLMLEAGVHFVHQTRYWNPKMAQYIFGHRNKIHIINLERTLEQLNDATRFVPTISTVPPLAVSWRTNLQASSNSGSVFSRLMMWILLRWPKIYGAILGFQKRVWWPKWTPASSI